MQAASSTTQSKIQLTKKQSKQQDGKLSCDRSKLQNLQIIHLNSNVVYRQSLFTFLNSVNGDNAQQVFYGVTDFQQFLNIRIIVLLLGIMTQLISAKGEENLRNFKYKGGSISISYLHLWSPLAEAIVRIVPKYVAPNTITLIGTIIHILGNLSLMVQGKANTLMPLSLVFFGVCVFTYYTLDNVDGKQARRTKSSSPLGMCMDHGCDVLGVSFIILGVAQVIQQGTEVAILITAQVSVLGTFWMSVWSQYHSKGILVLGKINAVDDGIPFVAFLGIFTYLVGQQWWNNQMFWGIKYSIGMVAFIWITSILQIIGFFIESGDNFTKDIKGALTDIIHFPLCTLALISVVTLTDWHIEYFHVVYFTTALVTVRDTSYMHVCVVAEDKYNQWQLQTVGYIVGYLGFSFATYAFELDKQVQMVLVYSMLAFSVFHYFNYVIRVTNLMAGILGIRIFHLDADKLMKNN